MEIGTQQLDGWPKWLQIGEARFDLQYEARKPNQNERYMTGLDDHVWMVTTEHNGFTFRAGGTHALEAVLTLADELNRSLSRSSARISIDLPVSWMKTRKDCLRSWNK